MGSEGENFCSGEKFITRPTQMGAAFDGNHQKPAETYNRVEGRMGPVYEEKVTKALHSLRRSSGVIIPVGSITKPRSMLAVDAARNLATAKDFWIGGKGSGSQVLTEFPGVAQRDLLTGFKAIKERIGTFNIFGVQQGSFIDDGHITKKFEDFAVKMLRMNQAHAKSKHAGVPKYIKPMGVNDLWSKKYQHGVMCNGDMYKFKGLVTKYILGLQKQEQRRKKAKN